MVKWIEKANTDKPNIELYCPFNLCGENAPNVCHDTVEFEENSKIIGCRGITCEECWNTESEEK